LNIPTEKGIIDKTSIDESQINKKQYQSMISSLLYLAIEIRLDISYCVNVFSQFNADPPIRYLKPVQWILRYLKRTIIKKLIYKTVSNQKLLYIGMYYIVIRQINRNIYMVISKNTIMQQSYRKLRNSSL
jgi:hypothetical protein